jgi:AcrR family transcriptional regulator
MTAEPKWRRRAAARPSEIADAALAIFAERGYAAARLADIAARAGVSKAALYVYYPTKADLFRAVLQQRSAPEVAAVMAQGDAPGTFSDFIDRVLGSLAEALGRPELRKLARMVIAESGNFPELARAWHDAVVAPALGAVGEAIRRAQARNEVRPGDARLMAMTLVGPMLLGAIWREVMEPIGGVPVDLRALGQEHRATLAAGLLLPPRTKPTD